MLKRKIFESNEEVTINTDVSFAAKEKSFYRKAIEMLQKHWSDFMAPQGNYVNE